MKINPRFQSRFSEGLRVTIEFLWGHQVCLWKYGGVKYGSGMEEGNREESVELDRSRISLNTYL